MYVEIKIKGTLKPDWSDWLEGLTVSYQANGATVLSGQIADQAALLGLLNRIHGLNLRLLSFSQSD
jgi:haloalkane dehalogenase